VAGKRIFPSFLIFLDEKGYFRWSYSESPQRTLCTSPETFERMADAEAAIELMRRSRASQIWSTDEAKAKRR
jgi:uncharacterized protein YegP (UPF0339 family)